MKIDTSKWWNKLKRKQKPNNVRDLFIERAKSFAENTSKILISMEGAMSGIHEYMGFHTAFAQGAILEWHEIALTGSVEDGLIIMVGLLVYPPGSTVELRTGEKVEVSQNTTEYFKRLVRIGLPMKYAAASKEEVIAYLKDADQENQKELEAEKEAITESFGKKEETKPAAVKKQNDTITSGDDFDLTQLTEEQRKNLFLSAK